MAAQTLRTMWQLLLASIQAQLLLVGGGVLALAAFVGGGRAVGAAMAFDAALPALVIAILVAASARAGRRSIEGYDSMPLDVIDDVLRVAPRATAHVGVIVAACTFAWFLAMAAGTLHPLAGLVALPAALLLTLVACAPTLLALAAVASGDREWLPGAALTVWRRDPWSILAMAVAGLVLVGMLSLPIALTGLVASTLLGPLAPLGVGLVGASVVPWLGCGALAAWRVLGGDDVLRDRLHGADSSDGAAALHALGAAAAGAATESWVAGPAWDAAIDAGSAFGTWVRMPAACPVAISLTWHGGIAPELALAGADGSWWSPGPVSAPGVPVRMDLPAGDTYLQVSSRAATAQAVSVQLLLPASVAA